MGEPERVGGDVSESFFSVFVLFEFARNIFLKFSSHLLQEEKKKIENEKQNKNRTFLDEELRIGRGDKGSIFVTARRKGQK